MNFKMDSYLKEFVEYCKENFGKDLAAITIYGSYAFGYFDKDKSDYDIFLIFKNKKQDKISSTKKRKMLQKIYYTN